MKYLNPEEFKQRVLKLKTTENQDRMMMESIKDEAVKFCSILPEVFGDELDRKTLWTRIGSALDTSIIKSNDDIELFVNFVLEHIKADKLKVAKNEFFLRFMESNNNKPDDWKKQFFNYMSTRGFLIIAKSRQNWEKKKSLRVGV